MATDRRSPNSKTRVKVCGLTRVEDVRAALDAGADWLGLNFHPPSPRSITIERARELIAAAPDPAGFVGVFVSRPSSEVETVASTLGLGTIQLHGEETPEDYLALARFRLIRAYRLGDLASVERMTDDLERADRLGRRPDLVLVDAYVPGLAGGTGRSVSDTVLNALASLTLPPLILAGGLTPENVADLARRVRPWMVDVASGVEASPGIKDPVRIRAFVQAVQGLES